MSKKFSPCGTSIVPQHGYFVDKDGSRQFGKIGDVDMRQRIQAAAKGSTLYEMIEKYQKTGDDSFLRAKQSAFEADLTKLPQNLIELYNLKNTCADDFYKFPVDFRALFNHNVDDYFAAIQNKEIDEITKKYFETKDKSITDKVVEPQKGGEVDE